jgi:hypothetical protein
MDHRGSSHDGQTGGNRTTRLTRHAIVTAISALVLWGAVPAAANASTVWQWAGEPITTTKPVKWQGTFKLQIDPPGLGYSAVKCEDTGTGTVGPAGVGEVKTWTFSSCHGEEGCKFSGATIEAMGLPWTTELTYSEGKILNVTHVPLKVKGGFKLKCESSVYKINSECPTVPNATMSNSAPGVLAEIWQELNPCSESGLTGTLIASSQKIELTEGQGHPLTVHHSE